MVDSDAGQLTYAKDILWACRSFSNVTEKSLDQLCAIAHVSRFRKGEMVFRQGDPCPGLYVVGSGSIRVFTMAPNGKEHVLHFIEPGLTFAEVAAIGGFPCPAFAEALSDSRCVLLPTEPLKALLRRDHDVCLQIMTSLCSWVHNLVGLMGDIVLRDAGQRLARYLLDVGGEEGEAFALPNLKKDLASHLNLTSETFSRTLRRLQDAGLIEQLDGGRMRIARHDELQNLADGFYPML